MASRDGVSGKSLTEDAYQAIKHRIMTLGFRPGEYLNEARISKMLDIGRTPVHHAVGRLMREGMIQVIPRKGVIIQPLSLDEIIEIVEVRTVTECYCVRLTAERADASEIASLADILARAKKRSATRDIDQIMLLDRDFHMAIARASRNVILTELLRGLHERSLRYWYVSLTTKDHHAKAQQEHDEIFEAIRAHDPDAAEAGIRNHIESFRLNLMPKL